MDAYAEVRLWVRSQFPEPVPVPAPVRKQNVTMGGYLVPGKCAEYTYDGKKYITFQPDTLPKVSGAVTEDAIEKVIFVYGDVTHCAYEDDVLETLRRIAGPHGDFIDQNGKRVTLEQLLTVLKYLGQLPSNGSDSELERLIVNTAELEEYVFR